MNSLGRFSSNFIVNRLLKETHVQLSVPMCPKLSMIARQFFSSPRQAAKEVTTSSTKKSLVLDDEPVVFTQSPAYRDWKAMYIIELPDHRPPIQRPVCLTCIVIFMLYFFVLREENDLDALIYQPLTETVPELEVSLLEATYESHIDQNLPTEDIEKKIAEAKTRASLKQMIEMKDQAKKAA